MSQRLGNADQRILGRFRAKKQARRQPEDGRTVTEADDAPGRLAGKMEGSRCSGGLSCPCPESSWSVFFRLAAALFRGLTRVSKRHRAAPANVIHDVGPARSSPFHSPAPRFHRTSMFSLWLIACTSSLSSLTVRFNSVISVS